MFVKHATSKHWMFVYGTLEPSIEAIPDSLRHQRHSKEVVLAHPSNSKPAAVASCLPISGFSFSSFLIPTTASLLVGFSLPAMAACFNESGWDGMLLLFRSQFLPSFALTAADTLMLWEH